MAKVTTNQAEVTKTPFQELYTTYSSLVYNTALSFLQNIEDAEEVTQDVFVNVYHHYDGFKEKSALTTWLYRITVNTALDVLKSKKRKKRFARLINMFDSSTQELKYDAPDFDHPGILSEKKESASELFRAIAQLPLRQQTAIVLTQIEGLSYDKTAAVMKASTSAVESLVVRAKKNLKEILSDFYYEHLSV